MFRAIRGLLVVLIVLALVAVVLYVWARTSRPVASGTVVLPGLSAPVEVVRDADRVPTIIAASQEDLLFALGFVHAQDRLWQLEYHRLEAHGRLSEVLGERALDGDRLMRTVGLAGAAQRELDGLGARTQGALQAYCDGINAFLEVRRGALPPEFLLLGHRPQAWTPLDVLARWKLLAWQEAGAWADELLHAQLLAAPVGAGPHRSLPVGDSALPLVGLRELYRRLPLGELRRLADYRGSQPGGSRAWVVTGERSATGSPLLAVDRHGPLEAPAPWYLVRLQAPGIDVAGATLPGLPVLLAGRNARIAWAMIEGGGDSQDLFLERLSSAERGEGAGGAAAHYLAPDGWRELETASETIRVRGGEDVEVSVRSTRNGPLLSDLAGLAEQPPVAGDEEVALALRWTALQGRDDWLQGAIDLLYAQGWTEFREALARLGEAGQLALYADVDGHIGAQAALRSPVRGAGDGTLPLPGWEGAFDWSGMTPFLELPALIDPQGDAVTATASGGATGVPPEGGGEAQVDSGIRELLGTLELHTPESFERILADGRSESAIELLPLLRSARPRGDPARAVHAELVGWEGDMGADTQAPLLFAAWYGAFTRLLLADELGAELASAIAARPDLVLQSLVGGSWCDDAGTAELEDCRAVATLALDEAVTGLVELPEGEPGSSARQGAGELLYRHHGLSESLLAPLFEVRVATAVAPGPVAGGADQGAAAPGRFRGPVLRAVFDLGDRDESRYLIPTGQSGNPLSSAYRSLAGRWEEVDLLPARPVPDRAGSSTLNLVPRR